MRDKRFKYLPTGLLYFFYGNAPHGFQRLRGPATPARKPSFRASSNWSNAMPMRSGGTTGCSARKSTSHNSTIPYVQDLQAQFTETGRRLWVLDITSDLGIPTYVAMVHWMQNGHENIEFGSGAHFDRRIALLRSLTELTQFMSIGMMGGASGEKPTLDGVTPLRLDNYPFLLQARGRSFRRRPA